MADKKLGSENHLLSGSIVRLFGRTIEGVEVTKDDLLNSLTNKQLYQSLKADKDKLMLARVYAFSFEGAYYPLPKPTLFLVHGKGEEVTSTTETGVANKFNVQLATGIFLWIYDKDDILLRADTVIGSLDDILIDATLTSTSPYALISRGEMAARGEAIARGEMISRGEMIARNRFQQ